MEKSPKSTVSIWTVLAVIALGCLVANIVLPMRTGGGPRHIAKLALIVNNLHQIDLAKQIWASDHKTTNTVQLTKQDLAPYFGGSNDFVKPVDDERYMINPVGSPPVAILTRQFGTLPKGTIFRRGSNGLETILPNLAAPPAGAIRSTTQTNGQPPQTGSRR